MNIIVTGASHGIGFEVVKIMARHKQNHIVAVSRNGKALKELVEECRRLVPDARVTPYEFDLSQFEFYPFIVQRLETIIHSCDILVNNAGKLVNKPFTKFEPEEFDDTFNVNVKSPFFFTQALLPLLSRGAHVVNISSIGGLAGSKKFPGLAAYSASKAALAILSEVLAEELIEQEISVNCLAIGAVQTEMFQKAFPGAKALQNPAQIAHFIADFAINGSKYFNGKIVPVSISVP
ncbi:MAG TPA: SDR family oxidoreductase [Bacteroidales bacterium]|nr:SDR family oxidoreductase [Bacteroidales bacterium]